MLWKEQLEGTSPGEEMGVFVLAVGLGVKFRYKQSGFIVAIFAQEKPHLPGTAQEWVYKER